VSSELHPELQAAADARLGVFTSQEALAVGYSVEDVRAELGSRRWLRLRKGVYVQAGRRGDDDCARHLVDCVGVLQSLRAGPVLSHASAARLHDLVLPRATSNEVRLTATDQWRRGRGYRVAHAGLPDGDVTRWLAFGATSVARTLVDCAREWLLTDAVIAFDAAVQAKKVTRTQLRQAVLGGSHRVGISAAARALNLADGRAESPLETRGRLALRAAGLPVPQIQVQIHDHAGLIGRTDMWFEEAALAVEFDGQVKYTDPWKSPGRVLWDEKLREDRLRATGARVVRVVAADLHADLWSRKVQQIARVLATPYVGPRRFTAVPTLEWGHEATAA
jgi:predicted transcriptional regulator of viral defense system